jgi:hypothetical protein
MKTMSWALALLGLILVGTSSARAQFPKPGPEQEKLNKLAGTWDLTMKAEGLDTKGTAVYKVILGDMWLESSFEADIFGNKFTGKGLDTYDPVKKKYVSVWADCVNTFPMIMEGDYDKEKKTLTLTGEGRGPDGKLQKHKSITEMKDENTMLFTMYVDDAKEPIFTISYTRRK